MNVVRAFEHHVQCGSYRLSVWKLTITGLTAGADNVVPHTLPCGPNPLRQVIYRPQGDGGWYEYEEADATNLYIHVDASGPTSFIVEAAYPGN